MADTGEISKGADSLKGMLSALAEENKRLSTDLDRKRKERVARVKESRALQKTIANRMERLETQIEKGKSALAKHGEAMGGARKFIKQQEQMLKDLISRVDRLETGLRGGKLSIPDARRELLKMLEDLQGMKKQREKILTRTGIVNATNFPSFRVDP